MKKLLIIFSIICLICLVGCEEKTTATTSNDNANKVQEKTSDTETKVEEKKTEETLFYLWYDALGAEGAMHREEIEDFRKTIEDATSQKIKVRHATYQEIICNLCKRLGDSHRDYLNYITERYL